MLYIPLSQSFVDALSLRMSLVATGAIPRRDGPFRPGTFPEKVAGLFRGRGYSLSEVEDRILAAHGDYKTILEVIFPHRSRNLGTLKLHSQSHYIASPLVALQCQMP